MSADDEEHYLAQVSSSAPDETAQDTKQCDAPWNNTAQRGTVRETWGIMTHYGAELSRAAQHVASTQRNAAAQLEASWRQQGLQMASCISPR